MPLCREASSRQLLPSPNKPLSQVQVKLPSLFEQVAFLLQSLLPVAHSSTSTQLVPLVLYPALHTHAPLDASQTLCAPQLSAEQAVEPLPELVPALLPEPELEPVPLCPATTPRLHPQVRNVMQQRARLMAE